jgi:long-chain acyl-CoA synthetase
VTEDLNSSLETLAVNVAFLPDHRADLDPDGAAVSDSSQSLTNAQLVHRVRSASRHLKDLGVRPGDVVAIKLTNRVEFVVLLFAAWRLGAAITPINPSLTGVEVDRQLADSGTRLLVADNSATAHDGVATLAVGDLRQGLGWPDLLPPPDPSDLALIVYTSGTTGLPKGVMLDHANLAAMAAMGRDALELGPADRCLLILPLSDVNGIVVNVLTPLLAGARVVIADRFDPRTLFDVVEHERPTFFGAVPNTYITLTALPLGVQPDTSSLRFGICGAAPAPADLLAWFEARYGVPLSEGYGRPEGPPASALNLPGPRRAGPVGFALPGQDIQIIDEKGTGNQTAAVAGSAVCGPAEATKSSTRAQQSVWTRSSSALPQVTQTRSTDSPTSSCERPAVSSVKQHNGRAIEHGPTRKDHP